MAEVNNSLALGVKPAEFDIAKPLLQAGQINSLRANTAKTQQDIDYNQLLQDQGQNGMRPQEENTLSEAHSKQMGLAGQIGNMLVSDPSPTGVRQAIDAAKKAGVPVASETEKHLLSAPPQQIVRYGQNLRQGGQGAATSMETSGEVTKNQGRYLPQGIPPNEPIISRTEAATGGRQPTQAKVDEAISTGRNFDRSPRVTSTADIVPPASFGERFKGGPSDMFTPSVVRGPDGSISSSVTPATTALQGQSVEQYKKAGEVAQTAQGLSQRLDMMDHSAEVLNKAGWSSTGTGANARLGAAKSVNSILAAVGLPPALDPTKIANWEDLNKETTRAGFDLARTLGSREAATIVQSSVSAVPGAENSQLGFKLVSSGIRQAITRETDYYNFATEYAKTHRGNTFGADVEFNKQFPPKLYAQTAVANSIDPRAIERLKQVKDNSAFDSRYGAGMADFVLSHGAK